MTEWETPETARAIQRSREMSARVEARMAGSDSTWPPCRYPLGIQHAMGNAEAVAAATKNAQEFFYHAGRADALLWALGETPHGFPEREKQWRDRKQ